MVVHVGVRPVFVSGEPAYEGGIEDLYRIIQHSCCTVHLTICFDVGFFFLDVEAVATFEKTQTKKLVNETIPVLEERIGKRNLLSIHTPQSGGGNVKAFR